MKKKYNIVNIGIIISVIVVLLIRTLILNNRIEKNHLYTVAIINEIVERGRAGIGIIFSFKVNKPIYKGSFETVGERRGLHAIKNKKFIVKYNPDNPKNCKLLICYPLPDSAIPQIWKKIPAYDYEFLRDSLNLTYRFKCSSP